MKASGEEKKAKAGLGVEILWADKMQTTAKGCPLSALAAPDVVALGTLNFGSLEDPDALVVVVAPSPDDEEEFQMMMEILNPSDPNDTIEQPVVLRRHSPQV